MGRTVRTLEILAERSVTPQLLAEELDIHPRTALRMLRRLQATGYAVMSEGGVYGPTLKIVLVAQRLSSRAEFAEQATPVLTRVRGEIDELVHLCVGAQGGAVEVASLGPELADAMNGVGGLAPFHCTAVGKAILAQAPDSWESVNAAGLERRTRRTITDPAELSRELDRVQRCGYAVDDRENRPDLRCIAVPVPTAAGLPAAAIGVSGRAERLRAGRALEVVEMLRSAAAELGTVLKPKSATKVEARA